jgi:hypothetical protein
VLVAQSDPLLLHAPAAVDRWDVIFVNSSSSSSSSPLLLGGLVMALDLPVAAGEEKVRRLLRSLEESQSLMFFPQDRRWHSSSQPLAGGIDSEELRNVYLIRWRAAAE